MQSMFPLISNILLFLLQYNHISLYFDFTTYPISRIQYMIEEASILSNYYTIPSPFLWRFEYISFVIMDDTCKGETIHLLQQKGIIYFQMNAIVWNDEEVLNDQYQLKKLRELRREGFDTKEKITRKITFKNRFSLMIHAVSLLLLIHYYIL